MTRQILSKAVSIVMAVCISAVTMTAILTKSTSVSASSSSDKIAALEDEAKKLESSVNSLNNKLSSAKKNHSSLKEQQAILAEQRKSIERQISIYEEKIVLVNKEITVKEKEIAAKELEIQKNEDEFAQRVRGMYMTNMSQTTLNAILSSDSFSQLLSRAKILKSVSESDTNLIKTLSNEKKLLETAKADIVKTKEDLVNSKTSLALKEKSLALSYSQNQSLLTDAELAQKKYVEELQKNAAAIKAINDQIDQIIASNTTNDGSLSATGKFLWPVPASHRISDKFGWRILYGQKNYHYGLDIPAAKGTNIVAADSGRVIAVNKVSTGYGWHVIIDHGNGYATLYGHCSRIDVKVGQVVKRGEVIAGVGTTGNSTGNHLHIGIKYNNVWQDPLKYISP